MTTHDIAIDTGPDLSSSETAKIIADQNDRFRKAAFGAPTDGEIPIGQVLLTPGISGRDPYFRCALMEVVGAYDTFNDESDPYKWHEMGVVEIQGETVWFKIDLYDENYEYGSSDPTDLRYTRRVLTLLLPSEY